MEGLHLLPTLNFELMREILNGDHVRDDGCEEDRRREEDLEQRRRQRS
jgi:hypothetical protein